MAGIIPRHQIKGVDICGSQDWCYIIRSDLGCYMRSSNFHKGSDISIHALHPACRYGDHYIADPNYFYIIKGDSYRRVTDLSADTDSSVETLHPNCRGGDHYLKAFGWFNIIFQEKGVYRRTKDLSKDEFPLHPNCRDGLYYWGLQDHYYFLKPTKWGVEYYTGKDFKNDSCVGVYSVHPDVLNFLPGGLSVTNGPAFGKWEKIKTVSNDRLTPVTWQTKVTEKIGYNKEKMSEITHNWDIEASFSASTGGLAGLITQCQFSLSGEYRGSRVNTRGFGGARVNKGAFRDIELENCNDETEDEELISFELQPNQRLFLWQYQLGLGSDPVLFCSDLKITDQPDTPTEVP